MSGVDRQSVVHGRIGCDGVARDIRYVLNESQANVLRVVSLGVERYSNYRGYGDAFTWDGDFEDETPFDVYGRRKTTVVAIDATKFNKPSDQFSCSLVLRELNKVRRG